MATTIDQATYDISETDLSDMTLSRDQLPEEYQRFESTREGSLENEAMAGHGFPDMTAEYYAKCGRLVGHIREFLSPSARGELASGDDLMVASLVHMFRDEQSAARWIDEIFIRQFEENVGRELESGQRLEEARRVDASGFHGDSAAMFAVQSGAGGQVSSTILDFRVGRLLGVTFVVAAGNHERVESARRLAVDLERQMMRIILR